MAVNPVQKGQPLTARAWNEMAVMVNNITSASTEKQWGRTIPCTILNRSGSARYGGNILTVYKGGSFRLAQYKPDEARLAWLNSGFQLDGYAGSTNDYGAPALLIDGVSAGGIGRCIVPGLCAGFVTYTETDLPELCKFDADNGVFISAASNEVGDWKIIAASDIETGVKRVFAYLVPASIGDLQRQASKLPWGGGGSSDSSSGSGGSFEDNIRTYFDCSDAVKDPVLYYDDPDSSTDTPSGTLSTGTAKRATDNPTVSPTSSFRLSTQTVSRCRRSTSTPTALNRAARIFSSESRAGKPRPAASR